MPRPRLPPAIWAAFMLLCSALLVVLGMGVGSLGFDNLWSAWLGDSVDESSLAWQVMWDIRLPRTLGAWAAGALLGLAGAVAQGLFRNPLADPYLLGSSSGAALGVALMLTIFRGAALLHAGSLAHRLGFTGAAFAGAMAGVLLTLLLSRGVQHSFRLLLAGVIVGVVLSAMTSVVLLFSPDSLQAMQSFMLGSASFVGWGACLIMLAVGLFCAGLAWSLGRMLDGLSLGEATALSLGLPMAKARLALIGVLALATGTAVAQTGLIAFVGLAAPHLVRASLRCTHGVLLLCSALAGGVLLCAADIAARWLIAPQELPAGVLTAVLGGLFLLRAMRSANGLAREAT